MLEIVKALFLVQHFFYYASPGLSGRHLANVDQMPMYTELRRLFFSVLDKLLRRQCRMPIYVRQFYEL